MKNLITFCVIFLTTTLMLTSCGSLSIEKRHHNKGYYISHNNVKSSNKTVTTENIETTKAESNSVKEENQTAAIRTEENTNTMSVTDVVVNTNTEVEVEAETVTETEEANTNKKQVKELVPSAVKKTATKFKSVYSDSKSKYAPAEGDSLSLLWIVIIVLLILWLLGYLGGYGTSGLIHLLLVIALILLILWLLRII